MAAAGGALCGAAGVAETVSKVQEANPPATTGLLATLFGPDPYSNRTLLSVWAQAGDSGALTVTLPSDFSATRAVPMNLRGELGGVALNVRSHTFTFKLPSFAPASFRLE